MAAILVALVVKAATDAHKKRKSKQRQARGDAFVESLLEDGEDRTDYYDNYGSSWRGNRAAVQERLPSRHSHENGENEKNKAESHRQHISSFENRRDSSSTRSSHSNHDTFARSDRVVIGAANDEHDNDEKRNTMGRATTSDTTLMDPLAHSNGSHQVEMSEDKRKKRRPYSLGGVGSRLRHSKKERSNAAIVALAPGPV
ncbi:MAG: hypothetical protein M1831_001100 [Alyxoria varia]|nr:MAG: hypothetical protein M1831_001100 [Alyxoria varia]